MTLWISIAALTVLSLVIVLWPLLGRRTGKRPARDAYDLGVYKDQLRELDRDTARGLIAGAEAKAARNEIARRILAAGGAQGGDGCEPGDEAAGAGSAKMAALASVVLIPVVALGSYKLLGRPGLPDVPRAERIKNALANKDMPAMIAQVEDYLAANPKDIAALRVLAPAYRRSRRFNESAQAFARLLDLQGQSAPLLTEYGEVLVMAGRGKVTEKALSAFKAALKLDPSYLKARFFAAIAERQAGRTKKALGSFKAMLKAAPQNTAASRAVERQIAFLETKLRNEAAGTGSGGGAGPTKGQIADAAAMTPEQRQQMINAMVKRLSDRLNEDGKDLDGWLKLARARMVLGQKDKAKAALDAAGKNFAGDKTALQKLAAARKSLGLVADN